MEEGGGRITVEQDHSRADWVSASGFGVQGSGLGLGRADCVRYDVSWFRFDGDVVYGLRQFRCAPRLDQRRRGHSERPHPKTTRKPSLKA